MFQDREPVIGANRKLTAKQLGGIILTPILLSTTLLGAGCSAKSAENAPATKTPTKVEAEKKAEVEVSQSEQQYAEYLKTLSPEQVAVRESLDPDKLADMSNDEMAELFTIHKEEVFVDNKLDPNLYAEAFTARMQGLMNAGISEKEYAKVGGLDQFGTDDIEAVSQRYSDIITFPLFGYIGTSEATEYGLSKGCVVDRIMDIDDNEQKPTERYKLRVTVVKDGLDSVVNNDGSSNIDFKVYMSDNWDQDLMARLIGSSKEATDGEKTWHIIQLHNTQGALFPTKLSL